MGRLGNDTVAAADWSGALAALRPALAVGLASEDRDVWANLGNIALHLGDDTTHRSYFTAMLSAARADGAVMEVLYALNRLCLSQFTAGQWTAVRRCAEESASLARSIGQPAQTAIPLAWLTVLAAHQGHGDYDSSPRHHQTAHRPYEAACVQLTYGEQLRRAGRRVEARNHLKKALETFRDLHAEPLVDRAAHELRASGETARKRNPSTLTQLTPTELHIAQLVSRGMTNKDVAEQCWISPRTVAFHRRNVFTKTGMTSRAQLAALDLN